ncbi:hypothetical protein Lpar_1209 [Legionella parisiensis]|uniref:Cupin type-2 domain-containing protein n=1 Tax=Legionella parisiensis TaxID=45071 RepID=A0A1E5JQ90_9GAMM|nr:cupin domain-containing protein [Legionella parisiensis]KTD39892.1 hypothetical protein Lpar_1209 [Legionella parisiensis]OEH46675.1 hypothetical protein lpari_02346 [Legionella parisiensis]STX77565.1 Uncharacterised protein [Legionella parisiensis]
MVVKGTLKMELRDKIVTLNEGELYIVPQGIEHKPVVDEEVQAILLEPKSTEQTGGIQSIFLLDKQQWI